MKDESKLRLGLIELLMRSDTDNEPALSDNETAPILRSLVGEFVIVRSRNEGVNAGIVLQADDTGIILKDCIRLYYHKPENKNSCWYEGVARFGLSSDSKTSVSVSQKAIIENYSVTLCTDKAEKSIMEHKPHGQS